MIKKLTRLKVIDNSGIQEVQCIGFYKGKKRGEIGDIIKVAVKKGKKKGEICNLVIVGKKGKYRNKEGKEIRDSENRGLIILEDKETPGFTRIKGVISKEIRRKKLMKIITLGKKIQ